MYKKIILLLVGIFLLTGCDAEYNLTINDNSYKEDVTIEETNSAYWYNGNDSATSMLSYGLNTPFPLDSDSPILSESNEKLNGIDYYNVKDISNDNRVGIRFDGSFDGESFKQSNMIVSNYNRYLKATLDGNVVLSTGELLTAFENYSNLNTVTINIKTNNKVVKNNADEVNGDTYTWVVNRENYNNKSIYFEFKESNKSDTEKQQMSDIQKTLLFLGIIIGAVVLVVVVILLFVYAKNRHNNRL